MSKMPAKKKSCFQITSVTTAQGSSSLADDSESLDGDPDEPRPEDVACEVFDVSHGGGPGEQPGGTTGRSNCSSSEEEALSRLGSPGTVSPNPLQQQPPQAAAAPATCSSRFRVIKLDHGSGEPYRRGRWTCLEYYERETDSIRHGHAAEPSGERDSGLGGSHVGLEPLLDGAAAAGSHSSQAPQQPHFLIGQPPLAGAGPQQALHNGQQHMLVQGHSQTGHNGKGEQMGMALLQGSAAAGQNGKGTVAPQAQQFVYSQFQVAPSQHNTVQPPVVYSDYTRNVTVPQTQGTSNIPISVASSLPLSQSNSPSRAQVLGPSGDSVVQGSGLSLIVQPATSHPAVTSQAGGVVQHGVAPAGLVQPKSVTQHQPAGTSAGLAMPSGPHTTSLAAHNVPVGAPSASCFVVPNSASTTPNMPNVPVTVVQSHQGSHTTVTRSASLVQPIGLPVLQGMANVNSHMPQSNIGHFQTQPFAQIDDRRKSEPLPQPPSSLIADHTPFMKPPILDSFTNPLHLPATTPMNSLARSVFGISIPVDGDEDSVSSASVVAIDNKIEQAMDLVKSHLMYAVREEVEVLKEQIKELIEKNSTLERENALLKSLTNNDHLAQLSTQTVSLSSTSQQKTVMAQKLQTTQPSQQPNVSSA